ncbi:sensor histidine kinase [Streptomyces sp. NPDC059740]|uniref:sensor histidine kinase n=1 Tax=Streptomyces sp. NPDC059740 TaxID=3346926 RepID=UPI003656C925
MRRRVGGGTGRRRSLRTRLALAASGAVALVVVGLSLAAFLIIRHQLQQQLDLYLSQSAHATARQHRDEAAGVLLGECRYLAAPACAQIVPSSPRADPATPYLLPVTAQTRQVAAGDRGDAYCDITLSGHSARMLTTRLDEGRALQVAVRADTVDRGVRQAAGALTAVGCAGALLAAALGYGVSRTGLAPVRRLTAAAEHIAATRDAGHRIEVAQRSGREDELTRLAASFNTMLGELEASVTAQRRLVADASHELRTPLTALRTNTELLARADRLTPAQRERAAFAVDRQMREVTALVNDLIELARDEEPQPLLEEVRFADLTAQAVALAQSHWPRTPFGLRVEDAVGAATVAGVPARLARLLSSLLDNAAKFSPPGEGVEVALAGGPAGLVLTIRDHGAGIAAEDLPYIFDRFYRARSARALPGSGLGLAMARQIARAHHADLTAEAAPGGGTLFRLTIPAAAGAQA